VKLHSNLKPDLININCKKSNTEDILKEIIHSLKQKERISNDKHILEKLIEREKLGSTSIGNHTAVPHTKIKELKEPILFIGVSKKGIQYHHSDKELVHLIILILSPNDAPIIHLQFLAAAASFIKKSNHMVEELLSLKTPEELIKMIKKYELSDD
jgi:PTS system nitrogen regulatory IIA component